MSSDRHPRPTPRIPTVEGLRGFAALLVVFEHTVYIDWGLKGWTEQSHGITVLALLTGFLLSARFLRARIDRKPAPSTIAFLRARAVRIYPGYWVALGAAAVTVGLHSMGPGDAWRVITLTQTIGTDTPFEGLAPAWSLSLFFSFYFALPAWSWWRGRRDGSASSTAVLLRREVAWLLAIIALAFAVRMASLTDPIAYDPTYTLLGRADWFAIGMLLAALTIARSRELAPRATLLPGRWPGASLLGALGLAVASAVIPSSLQELRNQLDTMAAGLLVAAMVLHGQTLRGPQRWFASRPARALGRWSFGIFLWGYIVQELVSTINPGISTAPHLLLTFGGAIVLGAASWRWVERPAASWLRDGSPTHVWRRWRLRTPRVAVVQAWRERREMA